MSEELNITRSTFKTIELTHEGGYPPKGLEDHKCYRVEYGGTNKDCVYETVIWLHKDTDEELVELALNGEIYD